MAKTSGLGDNLLVGGFDLSLDVLSLDSLTTPIGTIDVTGIKQFANNRLYGLRDADMQFTSALDISNLTPFWVDNLHTLPRTDQIGLYTRGNALQSPALGIIGDQIGYDPTRDTSGALTFKTEIQADGHGAEWGESLTGGTIVGSVARTDTAATVGPAITDAASSALGGSAYFQLLAFTGTSVTIDIQSSTTSGGTYATTGLTSQAFTAAGAAQRVSVPNNTTINQFLKVVTTGTFTLATFAVGFVRYTVAGQGNY